MVTMRFAGTLYWLSRASLVKSRSMSISSSDLSFSQQALIEGLLCARHHVRCCRCLGDPNNDMPEEEGAYRRAGTTRVSRVDVQR